MIGGLLGIGLAWIYIQSSFEGLASDETLFGATFWQGMLILGFCLVIGILLFPRTIGMMFTPAIFIAPIAFLIGLIKFGFLFGLSQLIFGVVAWGITQVIAKVRPRST